MRSETLIALKCLTVLAAEKKLMIADDLSALTDSPMTFTRKVLQNLALKGIVHSTRGARGGFRFDTSSDVTIAEVMWACGDDPNEVSYVGPTYNAAVKYRHETTITALAKKRKLYR